MAAQANTILELNNDECLSLIEILKELDPQVEMRTKHLMNTSGIKIQQALEYIVTNDPVLWAKVYLNWTARPYQIPMLRELKKSRQVVFRLGRRLGKTEVMCVGVLWYAYTQINKGQNNQYDIVIATPFETQIDLVFTRLKQLYDNSPILLACKKREIQHRTEFLINGTVSIIQGLTAGANNSSAGANSTRGLRADILIFDEVDYIGSNQITNIINIRNEAPERIKVVAASTPSGKHEEYYKWCTNASKRYAPLPEDIKNNRFTKYQITTRKAGDGGNGWTEIYAPSNVNSEVLKINPDTNQTYLEDFRDELTEMRFAQEVMAEFGEENIGVYQKKFIQMAINEGRRLKHTYIDSWDSAERFEYLRRTRGQCIRCLGVDWDKYGAATHMVCVEYDKFHQDPDGKIVPVFRVLFHMEIPRGEFTYTNAMNKIIELNKEYMFDWIAIDKGYGEVQLEMFHQYGFEHPETGLAEKVVGYQFSQKINVTDPYTRKKEQKHMKPFMVNNSVNIFEKAKIVLNPEDKYLIQQLEEYRIKSISSAGLPVYSDENEHALDAMNLALLIFAQNYDNLLRKIYSTRVAGIQSTIDKRNTNIDDRSLNPEPVIATGKIHRPSSTEGVIGVINPIRKSSNAMNSFNRSMSLSGYKRSLW